MSPPDGSFFLILPVRVGTIELVLIAPAVFAQNSR
jgi:hypothetical protein